MAASLRERIATHEAGHSVAALTYGITLISVTIVGHPHAQCASYRPPQGLACEALLTFLLAGPEAEKEFCGASDDGGDRIDVDKRAAIWRASSRRCTSDSSSSATVTRRSDSSVQPGRNSASLYSPMLCSDTAS
jgi:hypothetical protein